jgi:hypothetical protein
LFNTNLLDFLIGEMTTSVSIADLLKRRRQEKDPRQPGKILPWDPAVLNSEDNSMDLSQLALMLALFGFSSKVSSV